MLFCDNEAVVHMINNSTSICRNCMVLIRFIVLEGLVNNTRIYARYVNTKDNGKAAAISRLQWKRFRQLGPLMDDKPKEIPKILWPMKNIWLF